jgi:adenylylsulfate kinase
MAGPKSKNITWHGSELSDEERQRALGARGCVVWFTGLSGSGKSTVSRRVEQMLLSREVHAYGLDGDNIRHRLNVDLGFSPEDRKENIRRVGEVAALFADACTITLTAFISPYRADRAQVRALVAEGRFVEVFVDTPLEICESRDPKGLYQKARAGEIAQFTGISAPYEAPESPEIRLKTAGRSIEESAAEVVDWLEAQGFIPA